MDSNQRASSVPLRGASWAFSSQLASDPVVTQLLQALNKDVRSIQTLLGTGTDSNMRETITELNRSQIITPEVAARLASIHRDSDTSKKTALQQPTKEPQFYEGDSQSHRHSSSEYSSQTRTQVESLFAACQQVSKVLMDTGFLKRGLGGGSDLTSFSQHLRTRSETSEASKLVEHLLQTGWPSGTSSNKLLQDKLEATIRSLEQDKAQLKLNTASKEEELQRIRQQLQASQETAYRILGSGKLQELCLLAGATTLPANEPDQLLSKLDERVRSMKTEIEHLRRTRVERPSDQSSSVYNRHLTHEDFKFKVERALEGKFDWPVVLNEDTNDTKLRTVSDLIKVLASNEPLFRSPNMTPYIVTQPHYASTYNPLLYSPAQDPKHQATGTDGNLIGAQGGKQQEATSAASRSLTNLRESIELIKQKDLELQRREQKIAELLDRVQALNKAVEDIAKDRAMLATQLGSTAQANLEMAARLQEIQAKTNNIQKDIVEIREKETITRYVPVPIGGGSQGPIRHLPADNASSSYNQDQQPSTPTGYRPVLSPGQLERYNNTPSKMGLQRPNSIPTNLNTVYQNYQYQQQPHSPLLPSAQSTQQQPNRPAMNSTGNLVQGNAHPTVFQTHDGTQRSPSGQPHNPRSFGFASGNNPEDSYMLQTKPAGREDPGQRVSQHSRDSGVSRSYKSVQAGDHSASAQYTREGVNIHNAIDAAQESRQQWAAYQPGQQSTTPQGVSRGEGSSYQHHQGGQNLARHPQVGQGDHTQAQQGILGGTRSGSQSVTPYSHSSHPSENYEQPYQTKGVQQPHTQGNQTASRTAIVPGTDVRTGGTQPGQSQGGMSQTGHSTGGASRTQGHQHVGGSLDYSHGQSSDVRQPQGGIQGPASSQAGDPRVHLTQQGASQASIVPGSFAQQGSGQPNQAVGHVQGQGSLAVTPGPGYTGIVDNNPSKGTTSHPTDPQTANRQQDLRNRTPNEPRTPQGGQNQVPSPQSRVTDTYTPEGAMVETRSAGVAEVAQQGGVNYDYRQTPAVMGQYGVTQTDGFNLGNTKGTSGVDVAAHVGTTFGNSVSRPANQSATNLPSTQAQAQADPKSSTVRGTTAHTDQAGPSATQYGTSNTISAGAANHSGHQGAGPIASSNLPGMNIHQDAGIRHRQSDSGLDSIAARNPAFFTSLENVISEKQAEIAAKDKIIEGLRQNLPAHVSFEQIVEQSVGQAAAASTLHVSSGSNGSSVFSALLNTITFGPNAPQQPEQVRGMVSELNKHLEDREREVSQQLLMLAQEKAQLVAVGSKLGIEVPNNAGLQKAYSAEGKSALETENDNLKSYLKLVLQQKEQVQQQKDQAVTLLKSHAPQVAAQLPTYPLNQPIPQLHTSQLGGSSLMLSADSSKFDRVPAELISPQLESMRAIGREDPTIIQASQLDQGSKDQEVYKLRQEINFKAAEINRLRDHYTFEIESLKKELALRTSTLRHEVQKYKTESERLISSEKAINIMGADSPLNQKTIGVDPNPAPDSGRRPKLAQLDLGKANPGADKQPTDRSLGSSGALRNSPNEASRLSAKRSNKDGSPMGSQPGSIQTETIKQRSGRLSSHADPSFIPSRTAGQNAEVVPEQRKSNTVSSQFGSRGRQSSNSLEVSASMKERNSPAVRGSMDPSPNFGGYDQSQVDLQHLSPLSQRHSVDNQIQSLQISQLKLQIQQNEKRFKDEISQKDKAYVALKKVLNAPNQPKKIEELAKLLTQKDKGITEYQSKLDNTDTDLRKQLENYAAQIDSLQLSSAYATARIEELNKALAERETNAKDIMRFSGERSPVASAKNADLPFGLPQHSLLHHPNITKTLEDNESNIFNLSKDSERYQGLAMRSQAELEIRTPRVVLDEITKILKQATKSETPVGGNVEGNPADKTNNSKPTKPTTTFSKPRPLSSPEEPLERVLDKVKILVAKIAGYEKELNEVKDRNLELERIKAEKVAENDELVRKLQGLRLEVKNLEKTIENFKDMIQNSPMADQLLRPASIETSMIKMDGNDMEQSKKPSIRLVSTRDVGGARPTLPPMAPNGSPERGRLSVKDNRAVLRRGASAITGGMNTFMSLPMTDDSNMGQMYDLIEELRRVGKAKDEVQGKIKDLLKEPIDDNNDSYSSGKFEGHRFNEETIKILEAHHWAGKRFFESEENSRTPGMMSPPRGLRKQSIGEEGIQDKDLQVEAQSNLISELLERIAVLERETNFYKRTVPVTTTGKLDPMDDQILPGHNNSKSGVRSEMFLPQTDDLGLDMGNRVKTEGSPYTPSVDQRGKMEGGNNNPKIDYKFIDTPTRFDSDSMQWMTEKPDPPIDINLSPVMAINMDKTGQGAVQVAISKKHHDVIKDLPQDRQLMLVQTVLPAIQNQTDIRVLKSALLDKVIEAETLALASNKQKELGYRTPEANPVVQVQKTKSEPEKPDLKIKIAQIEQLQAENQNLKEILEDIRKKFLEGKIVEVTQAEFPDSPTDPLHSHEELPVTTPKYVKPSTPTEDHVIPEKSVGKQQAKSAKQAGTSNAFGKKNKPSTNAPSKGTSSASNLSKKQEKGAPGTQEQPRGTSKLHKQVSDIQGDLRQRDPSRKSSGLQPDKAASTKNLSNEQVRGAGPLHTRPFSGPQSTRTVNTLGAGSEYDASSEALPQEDPKMVRPAQSDVEAENAAVENELEELLKATTGELANLQEKCMLLEEQLSIKDSQTIALRRDLAVMVQQLEIFKKENLIAINQEEIDQFKAITNQMSDLTKTPDDLIAENSELVEYLKKSKDETLEMKVAYLNALSTFQQTVTQLSEKEASPDQVLEALQGEQALCYDRSNLQLQQFNSVLWDAVVKQKKTASNLSKRVQTIERWNKDMLLGLPAVETEVQENLDLPPSLTPAELHALESVEFKPAQFPGRAEPSRTTGGSIPEQSVGIKVPGELVADNPRTSDRPRRSDDDTLPIPNETMVDLLLSMVGLTEDLRQICNDETKTEAEKITLLSEKIDTFELMGQDGKLDLANIQRIIGRPDSVGEPTESTNRRKPYSDIVEVPEEDDEEDTRRGLKSSVDRSKHNSRRQRLDSERRATESKEGSNETPGVSSGVRKTAEIQDLHKRLEDALEKIRLLTEQLEAEKRKHFVKIDSMVDDQAHESSRSVTQQSEDMMTPKGTAPEKKKPKTQTKKKVPAQDKSAQDKSTTVSGTAAASTVLSQTTSQTVTQVTKPTGAVVSSQVSAPAANHAANQATPQTASTSEHVELLKAQLDAARRELEQSQRSASVLQQEVSRLNIQVAELKTVQPASKTEMTATKTEVTATKTQKDSASNGELTRRIQDLENLLLTKDVEIAKLKSLFTNSKSQDVAIPGFGGLTSSMDQMLGDQLARLALELKKSQSAEESLKQEVSSLRSQLVSVQGPSSRPAAGGPGNDGDAALRARVADLEAQLAAATALINELQSQSGNLTVEDLSALRTRIEGLESQVISLQKEIESRDVLMSIKDGAIEDLKKQLNTHADKPKQNVAGRAQKAAMDDGDAERQIVKLISENQKLRENAAIFERNFEQRERELLDEINRLAGELTVIMNLQGTPVPASIHKTVENARLQSMLKNKEMVMNQMLEVMKNNKLYRR